MVLDNEIKEQLNQYLQLMENDILIKLSVGDDDVSKNMLSLIEELEEMSSKINVEKMTLDRTPSFSINRRDEDTGIVFAGVPLGEEFTSFILALLQVSGRAPKIDQDIIDQIKALDEEYSFETFVSLTCQNCPEVVQALNIMSVLNPKISHTMIDGAAFKEEAEERGVMAVPTIFLNGESFGSGRMSIIDILTELGSVMDPSELNEKDPFDVLVVGGGPAGASAAIYAARKGLRTGIVAERLGGQIMDTLGIENFISRKYTEGPKLAREIEEHVIDNNIDVITSLQAVELVKDDLLQVKLNNEAVLKGKSVIISTGARWRNIGVPGEQEFRNKGVAYCPHCDGPMFEGKHVAVIGGGNSGIEAAIDLAGIVKHVTVLEFLPELNADEVLQERLKTLDNVTVITNAQTDEITGTDQVNGLTYTDRETDEEHHIELEGVFVQIGLVPNTEWLEGTVKRNDYGEIPVNERGATNVPGVFAAGDCTDSAYKQIVISMGSGATAGLGAFDYLIRN